jgi:hypothetical protein
MVAKRIPVEVDAETAKKYEAASPADQAKLRLLMSLRLKELTDRQLRPLTEVLDEIGRKAAERGMTPEILEQILNEK